MQSLSRAVRLAWRSSSVRTELFSLERPRKRFEIRSFHLSSRYCQRELPSSTIRGPITWMSFGLSIVAGSAVLLYVRKLKKEKEQRAELERARSLGKPALGGPFSLLDQDGNLKTEKDFLGKWTVFYFGFTHCPDICPEELEKLSSVVEELDRLKNLKTSKAIEEIQPVFISVDPERDTPAAIKEYLKDFHPRLIGLTGSKEAIGQMTKAYRVYFSKGPADEDNDYIVDHSIIMYLVNPDGACTEYYGQNKTADKIVASITNYMLQHKKSY